MVGTVHVLMLLRCTATYFVAYLTDQGLRLNGPLTSLLSRTAVYCRVLLHASPQVWKIEDFLAKWSKASEGKGADDPIAIILQGEIETYRRCLPHLKSCMRGAGWEDNHWLQVRV